MLRPKQLPTTTVAVSLVLFTEPIFTQSSGFLGSSGHGLLLAVGQPPAGGGGAPCWTSAGGVVVTAVAAAPAGGDRKFHVSNIARAMRLSSACHHEVCNVRQGSSVRSVQQLA